MIRVVVDDLASCGSDAIVRPATTSLGSPTPAAQRLERVGGPEFLEHFRIHDDLAVGAAVVTAGGGNLPAEFVIHAVIQTDGGEATAAGVARAWLSALERAQEWQFARLTVPPMGAGASSLTLAQAADILVGVLQSHLENASFPSEVSFVVETAGDREAFEAALRRAGAASS